MLFKIKTNMIQRNPIQKEIINSIISTKRFITDLLRDRVYIKDFTSKIIPYLYEIDDYSTQINSVVLQITDVHKTFKTLLQLPDTYFTIKEVCCDILNNIMLALKNELFNNIDFFYNLTSNINYLEFDFDKTQFIEEINNMIFTNENTFEQDEFMIRTDAKYLEELKKLENNLLIEAKQRQKAKQMEMEKISIKEEYKNQNECNRNNYVCMKVVHNNKPEQSGNGDNYKGWNDNCKNNKGELLLQQKRNKGTALLNHNEGKTVLLYLKSSNNNINSYKKAKENKQFSTMSSSKTKKHSNNNKSNITPLKLKQVFTPIKINIKPQTNTIDVKEDMINEETSKKFENERLLRSKTKQINTKNLKNEIFVLETSIRKKLPKHNHSINFNIHNNTIKEAKFIINKITTPFPNQKPLSIQTERPFQSTSLENETPSTHIIPII